MENSVSEIHFSWHVTVPFWIMHVDLWSHGIIEDVDGKKIHLLDFMCDFSQFIISSITISTEAHILVRIFMSEVVMTFGMYSVVIIDDNRPFKYVFIIMCEVIKLGYWCLSRGNYCGNYVERYHCFLNKTQVMAGNDRGTHTVILKNTKTSQYIWNYAPINNIDITQRSVAIVR